MKAVFFVVFVIAAVACAQIVSESPDSNPATDLEPSLPLSDNGQCKIRPQTALQIQKMREGAKKMAAMVQQEVLIAAKRKAYVEQMTTYINDRIRELNKVKAELKEEIEWIETTNKRIAAVAEQEKIARYQDIVKCLSTSTQELDLKKDQSSGSLASVQAKMNAATKRLKSIKKEISK